MSLARLALRSTAARYRFSRLLTSSAPLWNGPQEHDTAEKWRAAQKEKPLNPHMTNTNSTIANEMPAVGKDSAPPELLSSVDPGFVPKDSVPENTERMTAAGQKAKPDQGTNSDLDVGEIEGGSFKVEPLRRSGEDANTMRARLLYQSRKRGTLESDLLLSTFADAYLGKMTPSQLQQYDLFLDENDWDIYYWATQEPTPTSMEYAEGGGPDMASPAAQGKAPAETDEWRQGKPRSGEWAQTVGAFKPAYRPVPRRWKNSDILALLRRHVKERSAGGVHETETAAVGGQSLNTSVRGVGGGGLGMMPEIRTFES